MQPRGLVRVTSIDERDRKAVVTFAAHGLDRRGTYARLSGEPLVKPAHSLDLGVVVVRVDDRPLADDVVDDNHAPRAGEFERPVEIKGGAFLVGVDEDEVERAQPLGNQTRERFQSRSKAKIDNVSKAGASDIGASDLGVPRLGLECDEPPAFGERTRQPNGAIAA